MAENQKHILVVDDDHTLRHLLEMLLVDAGYAVTTAGSGRDALVSAAADPPDLVVLDIVMPDLDGWETAEHLRSPERTSRIPILFLTALVKPRDQLRGWHSGCFDYLTKPFDIQELLEKVERALAPPSAEAMALQQSLRQQHIAALEQIVAAQSE